MTNSSDIRQYPPAGDCIRNSLTVDQLARQNEQRAQKNGAMLIYAAVEGAGDVERVDSAMDSLSKLPEPSENAVLERACTTAAYICGKAIGEGRCARWQYDAERYQIVPRGERPSTLTIE